MAASAGGRLFLRQEVEMKMSALAGLALVVGFGILLSSCSSNVGPPQGGDAPFTISKTDFATLPTALSAIFLSNAA